MLVLSRRPGEKIILGDNIIIQVVAVNGKKVRIGVEAPRWFPILREEIRAGREEIRAGREEIAAGTQGQPVAAGKPVAAGDRDQPVTAANTGGGAQPAFDERS